MLAQDVSGSLLAAKGHVARALRFAMVLPSVPSQHCWRGARRQAARQLQVEMTEKLERLESRVVEMDKKLAVLVVLLRRATSWSCISEAGRFDILDFGELQGNGDGSGEAALMQHAEFQTGVHAPDVDVQEAHKVEQYYIGDNEELGDDDDGDDVEEVLVENENEKEKDEVRDRYREEALPAIPAFPFAVEKGKETEEEMGHAKEEGMERRRWRSEPWWICVWIMLAPSSILKSTSGC